MYGKITEQKCVVCKEKFYKYDIEKNPADKLCNKCKKQIYNKFVEKIKVTKMWHAVETIVFILIIILVFKINYRHLKKYSIGYLLENDNNMFTNLIICFVLATASVILMLILHIIKKRKK